MLNKLGTDTFTESPPRGGPIASPAVISIGLLDRLTNRLPYDGQILWLGALQLTGPLLEQIMKLPLGRLPLFG